MSKICACIIAYNSEEKIGDLLKSLVDQVDYIVVGIDPKTTDKTREVCEAYSAIVYTGIDPMVVPDDWPSTEPGKRYTFGDNEEADSYEQIGFAAARQKSFNMAPPDADWLLWIDTDDTLHSDVPLRQIADEAAPDVSMIWFPYAYHRDEYGNVTTIFDRERLIRRSAIPKWQGALHETCATSTGRHHREDRAWIEQPNRTEDGKSARNLALLHAMLRDPSDHRARLYLAHQYFAATDWPEACKWYETFLGLSSPGDVIEEKWQALIYLTKARRSMGDLEGSIKSANAALLMCPNYADSYYELSHTYAIKGDYRRSIHWHEEGLKRQQPDRVMIQNPLDYTFNPFVIAHQAYYKLGHLEKAKEAVAKTVALRPTDQNLVNPLVHYTWVMERTDAVHSAIRISEHLLETNEPLKARAVLQNLPSGVESDEINEARAKVEARLAHLKDEVEYENFYFNEEEPGDGADRIDVGFPRVDWTIERLKAMGAKKVLEVGIGDGVPALRYARAGFQVVGIDIDPRRIQRANKSAVKLGMLTESYKEEHRATTPDITPDSQVQFHYGPAESYPDKIKALGPFDAIILQELLEHVPDPVKVLDEADKHVAPGGHVIITTPDGASSYQFFQNKAYPGTNHSGHVRALSQKDLESLVIRRGRLVESHLLPAPSEFILVSEYVPGEHIVDRPPVVIYCGEGLEKWTPDQINTHGLGGSETAVVKLAEQLVAKGLRVMVYGPSEGAWNGAFYRRFERWTPGTPVMAFIAWRNPTLFDVPMTAQFKYLWQHDTDNGDALTEERAEKMTGIMVLSQWHVRHMEEKYPFVKGKCFVVGNGIDPSRFTLDNVEPCEHRALSAEARAMNTGEITDIVGRASTTTCVSTDNRTPDHQSLTLSDGRSTPETTSETTSMQGNSLGSPAPSVLLNQQTPTIPTTPTRSRSNGSATITTSCSIEGCGRPKRNLHKFVYLSSPDRGLVKALDLWPQIRERLPDAELHIFYGWENYDKMRGDTDWKMAVMAKARQPGVIWRGRVGQGLLAVELLKASVMLYPSDPFNETFCIAALEAQAAGCVPLTRNNGALPETNARGILLPNDASDEAWCTSAVKATETKDSRRKFLHEWAITQTWEAVANRFLANIRQNAPKEPVTA